MPAIYNTSTKEGVDINTVFTLDTGTPEYPAPPFNPGEKAWGTDGFEFVYCTASVTITAGSTVLINQVPGSWSVAMLGGSTVAASANVTGMLAGVVGGSLGSMFVPAPTGTQRGQYFWVQRAGNCPNISTLASTGKLTPLHSTATLAGVLGSVGGGAGTTYFVNGIVISQATGSLAGPNTGILNYPVAGLTS